MRHANGAGLAATQIGEPWRIAVMEVDDNPRYPYKPPIPLTVAINPLIEPLDDEMVEINEGCLSVPLRGNVARHVNVRVRYLDRDGVDARRDQARPDRGHLAARVRPPRRRAVRRPGRRPVDASRPGRVRALPSRRRSSSGSPPSSSGSGRDRRSGASGRVVDGVVAAARVDRVADGRITSVEPASDRRARYATRLAGLTMPGFANAHSHAFHRALRSPHPGRGEARSGRGAT